MLSCTSPGFYLKTSLHASFISVDSRVGVNAQINIVAQFQMESKTAAYFVLALGCGLPILESLHYASPLIISKAPSKEAWDRFKFAFQTYCYKRYLIDMSNPWWSHQLFVDVLSPEHIVYVWNNETHAWIFNMDTFEYEDQPSGIPIQLETMEELMELLFQTIESIAIKHNLKRKSHQ